MRVLRGSLRMAVRGRGVFGLARLAGRLAAISLVVAAPRVALAGGEEATNGYAITLASPVVQRYYPDSASQAYPFRPANENPSDINFQDCEDNIHLVFNLLETSSSRGGDLLQIWAGTTDCTQATARAGAEPPFCWQVAAAEEFSIVASVDIYARSLTRFIDTEPHAVPNDGDPITGPDLPESACRTQRELGSVPLSLYFMFVPTAEGATPDASFAYEINASLLGPAAPTSVLVAEAGDASLAVDWSPPVDPDVAGFRVFVVDNGTAGMGAGDAGGGECASNVFVDTWVRNVSLNGQTVAAGISEVYRPKYLAGTVGGSTATSFDVTALPGGAPLVAGHRYAVAVAGYDDHGNTGLLSRVGCEIAVDDPSGAGGCGVSSGGTGAGGCTIGRVGAGAAGSTLAVAFGAVLLGLVRRRRGAPGA